MAAIVTGILRPKTTEEIDERFMRIGTGVCSRKGAWLELPTGLKF